MLTLLSIETNNPYVIAIIAFSSAIPLIKFIKDQRFKHLLKEYDCNVSFNNNIEDNVIANEPKSNQIDNYANKRSPSFHLNNLDEVLNVIENSFLSSGHLNLESNNWKFRKGKFTWGRKIYFKSPLESKKVVVSTQASPKKILEFYDLVKANYDSIISNPWESIVVRSEKCNHVMFPINNGNFIKYIRIPG